MANIAELATVVYVIVDDYLKSHRKLSCWRRSNNAEPAFTDAEVLTIGLLQSLLGVDTLKQTYRLVHDNIGEYFPLLPSYKQWLARLHQVEVLSSHLFAGLAEWGLAPTAEPLFVVDSKPVPVCKPIRHCRVCLLRDDGAYFGASSTGWYFGFKLHVVIHQPTGLLLNVMLTSGAVNDRKGLSLCQEMRDGILLSDKGYGGTPGFDALMEDTGLIRLMPTDAGDSQRLVSQLRQRVETTFSQCWRSFIDRVFSRSWRGLWNTIKLKLICYNFLRLGLISR
jgi:hypothetical protein